MPALVTGGVSGNLGRVRGQGDHQQPLAQLDGLVGRRGYRGPVIVLCWRRPPVPSGSRQCHGPLAERGHACHIHELGTGTTQFTGPVN